MSDKTQQLKQTLLDQLGSSDAALRKQWAKVIVSEGMDTKILAELLYEPHPTSTRFAWLLSDIGAVSKHYLFEALPFLYSIRNEVEPAGFKYSFATYWNIAGIPEVHEAEAIDSLFNWLIEPKSSNFLKTHTIWCLEKVVKKHPEFKNEFRLCLEDQLHQKTKTFQRRVKRILEQL